ncbi:MAG TPA: acetylxylan esterase [Opitutaceae bacterium]|nr:acetylxylan esterase [Opitutaceae bacterium]
MPLIDKPLPELRKYRGRNPRPADFDAYWDAALRELDATDPKPELVPSKAITPRHSEAFDLWFTGVGGARIYAKYVRPKKSAGKNPAVLQFHGYSGNGGDFTAKLAWAGEGFCVAAMDARVQGSGARAMITCAP